MDNIGGNERWSSAVHFSGYKRSYGGKDTEQYDVISDPRLRKPDRVQIGFNDIKFILKSTQFPVPGFLYIRTVVYLASNSPFPNRLVKRKRLLATLF